MHTVASGFLLWLCFEQRQAVTYCFNKGSAASLQLHKDISSTAAALCGSFPAEAQANTRSPITQVAKVCVCIYICNVCVQKHICQHSCPHTLFCMIRSKLCKKYEKHMQYFACGCTYQYLQCCKPHILYLSLWGFLFVWFSCLKKFQGDAILSVANALTLLTS